MTTGTTTSLGMQPEQQSIASVQEQRTLAACYQQSLGATGRSRAARELRAAGARALERLVVANEGLVRTIAAQSSSARGSVHDFEDLCSAGRIALIEAAKNYDPDSDVPFGTYAAAAVRREVKATVDPRLPTSLPSGARRVLRVAHAIIPELTQRLERKPLVDEIEQAVRAELLKGGSGESDRLRKSGANAALENLEILLAARGQDLYDEDGDEIRFDERDSSDMATEVCDRLDRSPLWDIETLLGEDWSVFVALRDLDGQGGGGPRQVAKRLGVPVTQVTQAARRVENTLASAHAQWCMWAPDVSLCFDELPAMGAKPSSLLSLRRG